MDRLSYSSRSTMHINGQPNHDAGSAEVIATSSGGGQPREVSGRSFSPPPPLPKDPALRNMQNTDTGKPGNRCPEQLRNTNGQHPLYPGPPWPLLKRDTPQPRLWNSRQSPTSRSLKIEEKIPLSSGIVTHSNPSSFLSNRPGFSNHDSPPTFCILSTHSSSLWPRLFLLFAQMSTQAHMRSSVFVSGQSLILVPRCQRGPGALKRSAKLHFRSRRQAITPPDPPVFDLALRLLNVSITFFFPLSHFTNSRLVCFIIVPGNHPRTDVWYTISLHLTHDLYSVLALGAQAQGPQGRANRRKKKKGRKKGHTGLPARFFKAIESSTVSQKTPNLVQGEINLGSSHSSTVNVTPQSTVETVTVYPRLAKFLLPISVLPPGNGRPSPHTQRGLTWAVRRISGTLSPLSGFRLNIDPFRPAREQGGRLIYPRSSSHHLLCLSNLLTWRVPFLARLDRLLGSCASSLFYNLIWKYWRCRVARISVDAHPTNSNSNSNSNAKQFIRWSVERTRRRKGNHRKSIIIARKKGPTGRN
ncbi:hypothetical protein SODALDRAFT_358455 [Sodiomyces alkalinus F11]|uniref:Uncharacterized protein n=1 Tax=Sodiomyces alkalinus (strain CBS 110278 / VKM F-3762 / F11) TaxID=1314773 RepID=A0A3N2PZW3_SODAK|nr:hypothetical protein SODALDRAFT_358455 [Sodiomyces alkalinus F11]ROT40033.1 hypothetical protein SODALDRAFT_358455 [Sodiomyces alkalinus F11]